MKRNTSSSPLLEVLPAKERYRQTLHNVIIIGFQTLDPLFRSNTPGKFSNIILGTLNRFSEIGSKFSKTHGFLSPFFQPSRR